MTYEELKASIQANLDDWGDVEIEDIDGAVQVFNGRWVSDGKYEHKEEVYADKERTVYAMVSFSRSGSYFSDYEYLPTTINEAKPRVITKTVYDAV